MIFRIAKSGLRVETLLRLDISQHEITEEVYLHHDRHNHACQGSRDHHDRKYCWGMLPKKNGDLMQHEKSHMDERLRSDLCGATQPLS